MEAYVVVKCVYTFHFDGFIPDVQAAHSIGTNDSHAFRNAGFWAPLTQTQISF